MIKTTIIIAIKIIISSFLAFQVNFLESGFHFEVRAFIIISKTCLHYQSNLNKVC